MAPVSTIDQVAQKVCQQDVACEMKQVEVRVRAEVEQGPDPN
jgi:hypothetical protein